MDRMKTFGMYALWIILFFIFSTVVSNVLISNSYNDLSKGGGVSVADSEDGLSVETTEASSNKLQGFYKGKVTNTSDETVPLKYVRIRSYSSGGNLLQTKYVKLEDLEPGETREFNARFDVGGIDRYEVDYVDEMPDDSTYVDKMFDSIKDFLNADDKWGFFSNTASGWGFDIPSVDLPKWAWVAAGLIVLYNLPAGFLIF